MTKKRFILEEFGLNFIVKDNGKDLTAKQTVDRLNDLNDKNIEMNIKNDFLKDENQHMRDLVNENEQLKKDLHNIRKAQFEDIKEFERLYKENQQFEQAFEKTMEDAFDRYMDSRIAEEVIDYIHTSFYEFLKIGDFE